VRADTKPRPELRSTTPDQSTGRPLRRDAQANLQRILVAAAEVFAEHGYGASMEQVAERAELGVGTLYRRFPNKAELLTAVIEAANQRTCEIGREVLETASADDGIYEFLRRWVAAPSCWRVISSRAPEIGDAPAVGVARLAPIVDQLIANAKAVGSLRADVVFSDLLVALMAVRAVADLFDAQVPGTSARHLELVSAGLRPGPAWLTPPVTSSALGAALAGQ
jgi:AcrR family transcriptional regulator